jgi:hypothetical protein
LCGGQSTELLNESCFLAGFLFSVGGNEGEAAHGAAHNHDAVLGRGKISLPHHMFGGVEISYSLRWGSALPVPANKLALVNGYPAPSIQDLADQIVSDTSPLWRREDVNVVKIGENSFARQKTRLHFGQRISDAETEQGGHQCVALFPSLPLDDAMHVAIRTLPQKMRTRAIPHLDKRQQIPEHRVFVQSLKETSPIHMVESTDTVNTRDRKTRVGIRQIPDHVDKCIGPRPVAQAEICWGDGVAKLVLELPRQRFANQPSESIASRHAAHFTRRLAQSGKLRHLHGSSNARRDFGLGNALGGPQQKL